MGNTVRQSVGQPPRESDPQATSRRRFLDYLLGTSAVATLGAIVYPIFRFMSPPPIIEAMQNSVEGGKLAELPVNSGKIFKFGSKPGILVRTEAGELKAFSAVCTHLECIVQYRPDTKQIWCACHNGQYNLSGKNIGGPPPRPLEEYKVNTRGEEIVITKS
jgi:cytochrome b6-f complex iron-sulfur subunit